MSLTILQFVVSAAVIVVDMAVGDP